MSLMIFSSFGSGVSLSTEVMVLIEMEFGHRTGIGKPFSWELRRVRLKLMSRRFIGRGSLEITLQERPSSSKVRGFDDLRGLVWMIGA